MISGMTGFSTRSFVYKGRRYVINIRSVNHKFIDCVINLPDGLLSLEAKIKKGLSKFLKRGRVTFRLLSLDPPMHKPILNKQLLFEYSRLIKSIDSSLSLNQGIVLSDVINLPEVIFLKSTNEYSSRGFLAIFDKAMKNALRDLVSLRKKEGRAIYLDLRGGIWRIGKKIKIIDKRLKGLIRKQKKTLDNDDLKEFLSDNNIAEEMRRLEFHIKTFKNTIAQTGALGKVLDFMSQEMQREINTLSAKLRDTRVSYQSVFIKDEIEKIREQLQNVE